MSNSVRPGLRVVPPLSPAAIEVVKLLRSLIEQNELTVAEGAIAGVLAAKGLSKERAKTLLVLEGLGALTPVPRDPSPVVSGAWHSHAFHSFKEMFKARLGLTKWRIGPAALTLSIGSTPSAPSHAIVCDSDALTVKIKGNEVAKVGRDGLSLDSFHYFRLIVEAWPDSISLKEMRLLHHFENENDSRVTEKMPRNLAKMIDRGQGRAPRLVPPKQIV